jgi:hypothetical protein
MILDEIEAGIVLIEKLQVLIPAWIERARAAGELTADQEAAYKQRQAVVFGKDYAQPAPPAPPTRESPTNGS